MKNITMIVAGVVILAAGAASAIPPPPPLPGLVLESDLIVIAKVTAATGPVSVTRRAPGRTRPVKGWWRTFDVAVEKVLRDRRKPAGTKKAQEIKVLGQAAAPKPPGGPIEMMVMGGPTYPKLVVGRKYLLFLKAFPDKTEGAWFLQSLPWRYRVVGGGRAEVVRENLKIADRVAGLADVEKWPWGPAVGGLRLAALPDRPEIHLRRVQLKAGQPPVQRADVKVVVALRNTTDKPLAVSLYAPDRFLSITYAGEGTAGKSCDLYGHLGRSGRPARPFDAGRDVKVIKPGDTLLIGPRGANRDGAYVQLDTGPGTVKLKAGYTSRRNVAGTALWKGKLESASASVAVKARAPGQARR